MLNFQENELPMLETVEELSQWNVKPVETFTVPPNPASSPCKLTDVEQLMPESNEDGLTCNQCGQMFMSRKRLHLHERSHAAMAAIKKQSSLSTSTLKHKYEKPFDFFFFFQLQSQNDQGITHQMFEYCL